MSLINEALKKAQTDRPPSERPNPEMIPGGMPPVQKPPRKKHYLFGFILAVLIVGVLSALVSTYLVYQLLGDDESEPEQASVVSSEAPASTKQSQPTEPESMDETRAAEEPAASTVEAIDETPEKLLEVAGKSPEELAPEAEELVIAVPEAVVEERMSTEEPVKTPAPPEPVVAVTEPVAEAEPATQPPAPVYVSQELNSETWRRLDDFEIRGIMAAKVLIHDNRSGRARTYKIGDLIDGSLGLRIHSISNSEIQFRNNDGSIFPKAF